MNDLSQGHSALEAASAKLASAGLDRVLEPIETARGLPNVVYNDPDVFALEQQRIFSSHWSAIGFASDVPEPGSAWPVTFAGQPLMMVRDRKGEVQVFHNICRHRGHPLVSEPCKLKGSIVCPYHAWTYTLDGDLRGTPNIGGPGVNSIEGFNNDEFGLFRVRSHVFLDTVYVDLSGSLPDFEVCFAPLIQRWEQFWGKDGDKRFIHPTSHGDLEFSLNTNWKFPVENYVESYHLPTIHPELNSYSRIEDHYHIMQDDLYAGQGTLVYDFAGQANITLPRLDAWPDDKARVAEYVAIYPNVLLGIQIDHCYSVIVEPGSFEQTRERFRLLYLEESAGPEFDREREIVKNGWDLVFKQDVGAVEGMQSGRYSSAYDGGVFSPVLDNPTHQFHGWVARRLAA